MLSAIVIDTEFSIVVLVALLLAAITKSAQTPFRSWLPLAIAAPTPVSSLVHSRTLVTAGIVLLIKGREKFPALFRFFIFILGLITTTLARIIAMLEEDLKKIIALSTLSQLGFLFIRFGLGLFFLMLLHLLSHALFKSLLFFQVGVVIHQDGNQDMRNLKLSSFSVVTKIYIGLTLLSLSGLAFTSGMMRKDLILERNFVDSKRLIVIILYIVVTFTILYSFRVLKSVTKVNNQVAVYTFRRFKAFFSSLMLFVGRTTAILSLRVNLLILPVSVLTPEKLLFLLFLTITLLFTQFYKAYNLPTSKLVGSPLLLIGKSRLLNFKFVDFRLLVKDNFLYYSTLGIGYRFSRGLKINTWFLFFTLLILISF